MDLKIYVKYLYEYFSIHSNANRSISSDNKNRHATISKSAFHIMSCWISLTSCTALLCMCISIDSILKWIYQKPLRLGLKKSKPVTTSKKPASTTFLFAISCKCSKWCNTEVHSYRKADIKCSTSCYHLKGHMSTISAEIIINSTNQELKLTSEWRS